MSENCEKLRLNFRVHKKNCVTTLQIPKASQISNIKRLLCQETGLEHEDCEIVFCGRVLANEKAIEDYSVASGTVLHVVCRQQAPKYPEEQSYQQNSYLTGIWLHRLHNPGPNLGCGRIALSQKRGGDISKPHPQYYVYCKNDCWDVRPGKLRSRCGSCKEDSIVLKREPCNWSDVLHSNQIMGTCYSELCSGCLSYVEFYFKCSVCTYFGSKSQDNTVPLLNVHTNTESLACLACLDISPIIVKFPCGEHILCLECFEQYLRTKLLERRLVLDGKIGYSLPCPEKCPGSLLEDTHLFYVLGVEGYRTYQKFAAEECLFQQMRGVVCPNPKCGAGLYLEQGLNVAPNFEVRCVTCGHSFCSTCREKFHGSTNCINSTLSGKDPATSSSYFATIKTIEKISKACPNCAVHTEKNGGCMHMTCFKCKFEWCWTCQSSWKRSCQTDHWFG